ncbi:MAG: GNAT family N-acetyltransferase [Anaerolineae bacterium]
MDLEIKPIRSLYDLKRTHDIQRNTWGYRDVMIIPYTQLVSAQHSGGTLLGAYLEGELVGFVYGYLGMSGGRLYLFSQRMGVLPNVQSKGIGTRLKLAQRERMLRQGIDTIVWTYDPLEGKSAMVNLEKLGGIVRTYVRDIYGNVDNPLQAGLAMDRFLLEWHLMSDRVRERIRGDIPRPAPRQWLAETGFRLVNYANWDSELPRPIAADLELDDDVLLVQVPSNLQPIKRRDLSVARGWRTTTRAIFETYFRRGYVVTGFASNKKLNAPNIYRLEQVPVSSSIDFSSWAAGIEDTGQEEAAPNPAAQ